METVSGTRSRFFYGYWIVLVTFLQALVFSGCGFYAFSLFIKPLQSSLHVDRAAVMTALTLYFLIGGISAPLVGRLVSRFGVRIIMAIGPAVAGIGFISLSFVSQVWQLYVCYLIVGIGLTGTGMVPATTVISNWFSKRRGTALGIMTAGIGAGGLALAPLIGGAFIPHLGWQWAYRILAFITWSLIPLALLVIRTRPADMGLFPDGAKDGTSPQAKGKASPASDGVTWQEAIHSYAFWLTVLSFMTFGIAEIGILQNEVPYLQETGFTTSAAATIHGIVGLWSTFGKFFFGWLSDRIHAKYAFAIGSVLQLVGVLLIMRVSPSSPTSILWLYAFLVGFGVGNWAPTMSMIVSTTFGLASYSVIFGMIGFTQGLGSSIGPIGTGLLYDIGKGYHWIFIAVMISYAISVVSILPVRRPGTTKTATKATAEP